jgi:hypothetical protein
MVLGGNSRAVILVSCTALLALAWGRHTGSKATPSPGRPMPARVTPTLPKVEEATPIAIQKDLLGKPTWNPAWDQIVEDALPRKLLSSRVARDVRPFCPRFKKMSDTEKRAFWAYFFQALAGAEAGLLPTSDVRHPEMDVKDTVTRRMVRAEGLLQLTYMDADRYDCDFDWDEDKDLPHHDPAKTILQPKNNLTCGVKILDDQLIARHERLLSPSSYWETLRPGTAGYEVFLKQMTNVPAFCRIPRRHKEMKKQPAGAAPAQDEAHRTAVSPP